MTVSMQKMLPVGWLKARSRGTGTLRTEKGRSGSQAEVFCLLLTHVSICCYERTDSFLTKQLMVRPPTTRSNPIDGLKTS